MIKKSPPSNWFPAMRQRIARWSSGVVVRTLGCGIGMLATLAAVAENFGDLEVQPVASVREIAPSNGYFEQNFRLINHAGRALPVEMRLRLEVPYSIQLRRSLVLPPGETVVTSLYAPVAMPQTMSGSSVRAASKLKLYVDGTEMENSLMENMVPPFGFAPVLASSDISQETPHGARYLSRALVPVAQWSTQWRTYEGYATILISGGEYERLTLEVRQAVMTWVEMGGKLMVAVAPEAPWPAGVSGGDENLHFEHVGLGQLMIARPFTAAYYREAKAEHAAREGRNNLMLQEAAPAFEEDEVVKIDMPLSNSGGMMLSMPQPPAAAFQVTSKGVMRGNGELQAFEAISPAAETWMQSQNWSTGLSVMPEMGFRNRLDMPIRETPSGFLFLVMVLFVALIGPVNYWLLRRKRRESWILLTAPAIALLFCALIIAFITVSEGWSSRSRSIGFTWLNQDRHEASTLAAIGFYAPIPQGRGFVFGADEMLVPQSERPYSLDISREQNFTSGLAEPRVPAYFGLKRRETRYEQLQLVKTSEESMEVVNGFGVKLEFVVATGPDGRIYRSGEPIEAGARAQLARTGLRSEVPALDYTAWAAQFRGMYFNTAAELDTWQGMLPPLSYVTEVKTPLFYSVGKEASDFGARNIIIGQFNSGEETHAN